MKPNVLSRSRGFTLIELLVVISIIAILAALAIPAMRAVVKKGKSDSAPNPTSYGEPTKSSKEGGSGW